MKVSVIMPTYNRAYIIEQAMKSVLQQSFPEWELIIVDDGSTDATEEIVKKYVNQRIRYVRLVSNHGGNYARNIGIENSTGEFLAFLDSDNEWMPDALASAVETLEKMRGEYRLITAVTAFHYLDGTVDVRPAEKELELMTRESLLKNIFFFGAPLADMNTYVFSRNCISLVGGFDVEQRRGQDWELLIRLLSDERIAYRFLNRQTAINYIQENSISNQKDLATQSKISILTKHADVARRQNCFQEACYQFMNKNLADISGSDFKRLLDALNGEEAKSLFEKILSERDRSIYREERLDEYYGKIIDNDNRVLSAQSKWLMLNLTGESVAARIKEKGYASVSVYGYGYLGRQLCAELKKANIRVDYLIDRNAERMKEEGIPAMYLTNKPEDIKNTDVVIVTAVAYFEEIKESLKQNCTVKVISIEELL